MIILSQMTTFSIVGQHHTGWIGKFFCSIFISFFYYSINDSFIYLFLFLFFVAFMQDKILSCLSCVWFNRTESKDRSASALK